MQRYRTKEEIKTEIIGLLETKTRLASWKIAALIGYGYYSTLKLLDQLVEEGSIVKEMETNATYWKIKNEEI